MPPRPIIVQSTRDLGPQLTRNPHRMIGQDGAFSIPLDQDQSLWFFGDTLTGRRTPGESLWYPGGQSVGHADMSGKHGIERMINNAALLAPNRVGPAGLADFRYLTLPGGHLRTLLPLEGSEHPDWDRIWCQHGIRIGSRLYLSFIQVRMLADNPGPLPIGFEIAGSGLAVGSMESWTFRRLRSGPAGHLLWSAGDPHFAAAFLRHDPFVYLYGVINRDALQQAFVARVAPDSLEDLAAYEYLAAADPPRWSPNVADAHPLFSNMPSELSISYNAHLNAYLAVHSLDLTGQLVARTAPTPWGPFSPPTTLFTAHAQRPKPLPYPLLIYAGKEHPQLSRDDGRTIYLTYIEFEEYFPHLIEVTLA